MNLGKDLWELFGASPPDPVKSPKLRWLDKHGLTTAFDAMWEDDANKWSCYSTNYDYSEDWHAFLAESGFGATEDDAILDYCAKFGLKHWTVENL